MYDDQQIAYIADPATYAVRIAYDVNNNPIYVGVSVPGEPSDSPVWRIRRLWWDGNQNLVHINWPDGSIEFAFKWTDRETYTYI